MDAPIQTILVPVIDRIPQVAISYAEMLSKAYNKPISLLCLSNSLKDDLKAFPHYISFSEKSLIKAVKTTIETQDAVMVVWEKPRRRATIQKALYACRELRIPYFFIPDLEFKVPEEVVMPVGFLIEEREKATWGRSLKVHFESRFSILQPNDKGTRAAQNINHIRAFFDKHGVPYQVDKGQKSSFKTEKEAHALYQGKADLLVVTASRDYGLDDQFFGPKELWLIKRSTMPLMLLNPRDDLYVLCGD